MASTDLDSRRRELAGLLKPYSDSVTRGRRAYFDKPSFALEGKQETEFLIKSSIANHYGIGFRSVAICGSAQLGFSPNKDTLFEPGRSDIDIACVDNGMYQKVVHIVWRETKSFRDSTVYAQSDHEAKLKEQILRRGMVLLDYMPKCAWKVTELSYMENLSRRHKALFNRVSVAFYMDEAAFCLKQDSSLANIVAA